MSKCIHFSEKGEFLISEVGGKGLSLIMMTRAGMPVPSGFILPVSFFSLWIKELEKTGEWKAVQEEKGTGLKQVTEKMKNLCRSFTFSPEQRKIILENLQTLKNKGGCSLVAVRSSSPEEDLEGASFAGGYETILGVTGDNIFNAVKRAFSSCLDERVIVYKRKKGFSTINIKIAVIVQKQLDPDTAGVGFSINPLNNCYDEAVINANFGLGESVVAGMVTPDSFIVDKIRHKIITQKIGKKETIITLSPDGGTKTVRQKHTHIPSLTTKQVIELTEMVKQIEEFYNLPVDIEWAYEKDTLYLLQARPVTTYIPLPEKMLTLPGQPKKLYMDFTLIAQGIHKPLSVLGMDFFHMSQVVFMKSFYAVDLSDLDQGFFGNIEGRAFANISNMLKVPAGKTIAIKISRFDRIARQVIENLDKKTYCAYKLPKNLKGFLFKTLKKTLGFLKSAKIAYQSPEFYRDKMIEEKDNLFTKLKNIGSYKKNGIMEYTQKIISDYADFINTHSLKLTAASHNLALEGMGKLFNKKDPEIRKKLNYLERGLPNNVTIEMGLSLYRLSQFKEIDECPNAEIFDKRIHERTFSREFLSAWDNYVVNYGFRCPMELDLATLRPYEQPAQLFNQLKDMSKNKDTENNARVVFEKAVKEREESYAYLLSLLKGKKAKIFKKHYHVWVAFGGLREIHKYILIRMIAGLREKVLEIARDLVRTGRLDRIEQIFDLTFEQIEKGIAGSGPDLRAAGHKNTEYRRKTSHIKEFPFFIDSRGKIVRPPVIERKEGEYTGEPISAGIVRGRIKVLHSSDEKPLLPGEILVARATDPGWTPLFVNAAGVILEIGGMGQHGAVVAREYGKPCVAGIEDATKIFKDSQEVEIDGAAGIVRML